jgi:hypothetical protein
MFVCSVYMFCCPVYVEASATGWSLVQRSPTVCLIVCDQETPKMEAKGPSWIISASEWMNDIWSTRNLPGGTLESLETARIAGFRGGTSRIRSKIKYKLLSWFYERGVLYWYQDFGILFNSAHSNNERLWIFGTQYRCINPLKPSGYYMYQLL